MKKVLVVLVVVVVGFVGFVATRPSTFNLERSTTIAAPTEVVFSIVNDLHRWNEWSPWEKMDPALKRTFEGAAAGTGSIYSWVGNDQVGAGRMTITESRPNERVNIKLEFIKPFESTYAVALTLAPAGKDVKVTWSMGGDQNFMSKAFSVFMDMDSMVGKDFETGLSQLKQLAEADAKKAAEAAAAAGPAAVPSEAVGSPATP